LASGSSHDETACLPSASAPSWTRLASRSRQTYPDYPGVYWGDGNMLDAPASDFQVIEYLRLATRPLARCARC
jgi:hypothetical protein